jgi:hypothetical protein
VLDENLIVVGLAEAGNTKIAVEAMTSLPYSLNVAFTSVSSPCFPEALSSPVPSPPRRITTGLEELGTSILSVVPLLVWLEALSEAVHPRTATAAMASFAPVWKVPVPESLWPMEIASRPE